MRTFWRPCIPICHRSTILLSVSCRRHYVYPYPHVDDLIPLMTNGRLLLVDEVNENGAVARSSADAPEIDGKVFIENADELKPGDFAQVLVTRADEHDLWARLTGRTGHLSDARVDDGFGALDERCSIHTLSLSVIHACQIG
jgi:hypothetical protein